MHYKNYYTLSALFMTVVALLDILISTTFPILSEYHYEVMFSMFFLIIVEWVLIFSKDQRIYPLKDWYDQFIENHPLDFNHYKDQAKKAINKFIFFKVVLIQVYIMLIISSLGTFFIRMNDCYSMAEIINQILILYFMIAVIFIGYTIFNVKIHHKYYFSYLEPKNEYPVYLLMTYYLLQVEHANKIYINYYDLINTSAALTRILKFKESYEFLYIWRKNAKKINHLYSFVYIEHCLFDFVMLDMDQEVEAAYKDYQMNLNKYQRYRKNKTIERCTYLVDILYAYHNKDYQKVILLYQRYNDYFKENDYKDSHEYILYQAYLHIDENKALEIHNKNINNPFFKDL